ncbi:helix-turn-helix domain-containing protein [Ancylobacter sp. G4_0304]|uniref:helix-turn-helix domain-containing protein n=1 Tax=Ancylobacter sp. G4_0304 TaxID=3114289 RepID=UPI0039C73B6C
MTFAELQAALAKLNLSPAALAKLLGVDVRTARRWATGGKPIPDTVAARISDMLVNGITPDVREKRQSGEAATSFLWVRKAGNTEWTVAEHDRVSDIYYLPGRIERYTPDDLVLGPSIEIPGE